MNKVIPRLRVVGVYDKQILPYKEIIFVHASSLHYFVKKEKRTRATEYGSIVTVTVAEVPSELIES